VKQLKFKKGSLIYSCDDRAEDVYLLSTGSVALTLTDALGNERIIRFVGPGDVFGLDALVPQKTRVTTAVARERTQVCAVARATFESFAGSGGERLWRVVELLGRLFIESELEKPKSQARA
jgi:CRP-like cAMP-binding protein